MSHAHERSCCLSSPNGAKESIKDLFRITARAMKSGPELKALLQDLLQISVGKHVHWNIGTDERVRQPKKRPSTADLLSRRTVGFWLQWSVIS